MMRDTRPVFEKDETFAGWDRDYYTPITKHYYDLQIARMLRDLKVPVGTTLLDAGCGPGEHSIRVAQAGYRVHALDLSGVALREARTRVEEAGLAASVTLEQGDLTALPFAEGAFRAIFSWGVVLHIPEVECALRELRRVLAPGGRLALYLSNGDALDPKLESCARFVLRRPSAPSETLPLGVRRWYTLNGERLCVWGFDVPALVRHMNEMGLLLVRRRAGELSDLQRRVHGPPRTLLQRLNNAYARLQLPPQWATANLLIFERRG